MIAVVEDEKELCESLKMLLTDKVILRKVANYNPRNIKESAELQDEIDLTYAGR